MDAVTAMRRSIGPMPERVGIIRWTCKECGRQVTAEFRPGASEKYMECVKLLKAGHLCSKCAKKKIEGAK